MILIYKSNLTKRIFATLIDYGIYFMFFSIYILIFGSDNSEGGKTVSGILATPLSLAWFLYFVVIEALNGATLGHHCFDLKVVTTGRMKISFGHALKRHLLDPLDILFYGIPAIIAIKNSDKRQRIGDMWAHTIIVDTKDPEQYLPAKSRL
ncbi:RDD family protein [Flavobacterium antarcticum]|uniref:RDD family protein n=1 Tax=Flavobacterium antarcticum TaxID=271155 RepID=UPI0003B4EAF5|nr:RDD family protein [Flavobacterium antarcticum]